MRIFFLLFFLFPGFSASAQTTVIKGSAPSLKGAEISLYTYDDYITFREEKLASAVVSPTGSFELKANIERTIKGLLKIDDYNAHIYLEPGKTYSISIPKPEEAGVATPANTFIPLNFDSLPGSDLNRQIIEYNKKYDKFLNDNYTLIIRHSVKRPFELFQNRVKRDYPNVSNAFFRDYITYSMATLEQLTFPSKTALFEKYIKNRLVLYHHPEYMHFFNQFYEDYLLNFLLRRSETFNIINTRKDYTGLLNRLKADEAAGNETVRELILLKGLFDLYYHKDFDKKSIRYMLQYAAAKSPVEEHRKTAANILHKVTYLSAGEKAPSFSLRNDKGETVSLEDFKGRHVYLNFWATWCVPSLQDLKVMEALYKKYGQKIAFVSVSVDKNPAAMSAFLKKNPYGWNFLHYGSQKGIREAYEVKTVPGYFLIDPAGNIAITGAPGPAAIEKTFLELTGSKNNKSYIPGQR